MTTYHLRLRGTGLVAREDRPHAAGLWAYDNADFMALARKLRRLGFCFAVKQEYFQRG